MLGVVIRRRAPRGLAKLGVDAVQYDFPSGPSKAYSNRVLTLGFIK